MVAWLFMKAFTTMFCRVEVEGMEKLATLPHALIFASNHLGDLDAILLRTVLPLFSRHAPLFVVARTKRDYEWQGWRRFAYSDALFCSLGAYPAVKGTHDYATALAPHVAIGTSGGTVLVFTGGMQHSPDEPVKSHGGTGYLAWATGSPVVPVVVWGTYGFSPRRTLFRRRRVVIHYGAPLTYAELFPLMHERPDFPAAAELVAGEINRMREEVRTAYEAKETQHSTRGTWWQRYAPLYRALARFVGAGARVMRADGERFVSRAGE